MSLAIHPPVSLWASVWKLMRMRLLITYNNIRRANRRVRFRYIFFLLLIIIVLVGGFAASAVVLRLLRSPEAAAYITPDQLLTDVPVWVFTFSFLALGITSFGVMLQSLYLSNDMEFLLSTPISIRALFIAKMVEAILPNFGLVCLFGLPVMFGLGVAFQFSILYYPLVVITLVALALSVAAASSLFVMAVVRVIPARRVAEVLGFLGAIITVICSQSGQLANSINMQRGQLSGAISLLSRLDTPWSPLAWAGRGLMEIARGGWLTGGGLLTAFLLLAGGIFVAALITSEKLYYTGWSRVQVGSRRRKTTRPHTAAPGSRSGWLFRWLPLPVRGIVAKDFRLLTRDLRNMSQIVTPLLFGVIYAFALTRSGFTREASRAPEAVSVAIHSVAIYGNVAISLFIGWSLLSRLALMSFSQERTSYWLLKSSPVSSGQLLAAKFLISYLPPAILGAIFMVATSILQQYSIDTISFGLLLVFFSLAGAVGINLAFGVTGVNLAWQNPRQMTRGTQGCLASLASTGYMFVIVALFLGPGLLAEVLSFPAIAGRLVGLGIGIPVSLICAILPLNLVVNRVDRIGEEQ